MSLSILFLYIFSIDLAVIKNDLLLGNWKTQEMTFISNNNHSITIDLSDPNLQARNIYKSAKKQDKKRSLNKNSASKELRTFIDNFSKTSLALENNNVFTLSNYNLLIDPYGVPGWHFSDTIRGSWNQKNDTIVLSIENELFNHDWMFKILQIDRDTIRIVKLKNQSDRQKEILFKGQ